MIFSDTLFFAFISCFVLYCFSRKKIENINLATLAQLVEQPPCKRWVVGSTPTGGSIGE